MKQFLLDFVNWTWCFPQTLVGFIVKCVKKGKKRKVDIDGKTYTVYDCKLKSDSVSLGKYILLGEGHTYSLDTIKHEYGHQLQSYMLSWMYLLVVGLPSFIWCNCFKQYRAKHNKSYFSVFPENWANKLGGV